ncbi:Protein of unknown function [Pyronema omphalodes CBS 100304]|uniref:Uncharacterized protein n=1 Tax=Pyronema omphalodes (strain CBS 100304) TaxID=1076935 RepID=U4L5S9_PYROM|nr:Protein of unknown function [Pyronema omphalodes CBS 100304]
MLNSWHSGNVKLKKLRSIARSRHRF